MTQVTNGVVPRNGRSIDAVLREYAPDEAAQFRDELQAALRTAARTLDLDAAEQVIDRWWGVAHLRMAPPTSDERALLERARSGDFSGLYEH